MVRRIVFFLMLFLGAGCAGDSNPSGALQVRVENAGAIDFANVVVGFPSEAVEYGALASGEVSEYRQVAAAYRYAAFNVVAEGETYSVTPIDYVGETPLDPGRYTFVLEADPDQGNLTFELRPDDQPSNP